MATTQVNKDKFKKEVLEHNGIVFVDFYADWCGPCKMTEPIIHGISEEMKNVKFVKVNVDENPDLASEYSVFSIPTFIVFKNGKTASQFVGAMGREAFLEEIKKVSG
jgi:thioredoxin 1